MDVRITRGTKFTLPVQWCNADGSLIDASTFTSKLQIRASYAAEEADIALTEIAGITLGGDPDAPLTVSGEDGDIEVNAIAVITGEQSALLTGETYVLTWLVYDGDGEPHKLVGGDVYIEPSAVE